MNKRDVKIGFIGCGKMASAIIKGVIDSGFLLREQILASEVDNEFAQNKSKELRIKVLTDNKSLVNEANIVFLAIKPNYVKEVLTEIKNELQFDTLIVSIAAGVSINTIENILEKDFSVIRVMPNAPAVILKGMSGVVRGKYANDSQVEFIIALLSNIGKCIEIAEDKMDVLTAISGSGPAFFYQIIHEMALAGEKLGLEYGKSILLATQTAIGAAELLIKSELTPSELVQSVATKGGCTEVGVEFLKNAQTEKLFYDLIKQTAKKAKALGD